jgi:hypothetical protein
MYLIYIAHSNIKIYLDHEATISAALNVKDTQGYRN